MALQWDRHTTKGYDDFFYHIIVDIDLMMGYLQAIRGACQSQIFTYANTGDIDPELQEWIQRRSSSVHSKMWSIYKKIFKEGRKIKIKAAIKVKVKSEV